MKHLSARSAVCVWLILGGTLLGSERNQPQRSQREPPAPKIRPLEEVDLQVEQTGHAPQPLPLPEDGAEPLPGDGRVLHFGWVGSELWFHPLYFEETVLERYGQSRHPRVQPAISTAHFFLTIPALPLRILHEDPVVRVYSSSFFRPGEPLPWLHKRVPR